MLTIVEPLAPCFDWNFGLVLEYYWVSSKNRGPFLLGAKTGLSKKKTKPPTSQPIWIWWVVSGDDNDCHEGMQRFSVWAKCTTFELAELWPHSGVPWRSLNVSLLRYPGWWEPETNGHGKWLKQMGNTPTTHKCWDHPPSSANLVRACNLRWPWPSQFDGVLKKSAVQLRYHEKIGPPKKLTGRYCPLVMQGFSHFLGLFQVIMASPELENHF